MLSKFGAQCSVIALIGGLFGGATASAQDAAERVLDEVLVTATKKVGAESSRDAPLAVTAYSGAQLDALKVRDLQGLSTAVPNVALDDIGTFRGTASFSIRGLGVNSSIPSIDPAVGVFVDGMYLGVNAGVVFDLFDLESIEVLRGPQGILFGRNVTGGAVLVNTKSPSDDFEMSVKSAVESGLRGTGANHYLMGTVSGPISKSLSGRISAYYNEDRGWHKRYLGGAEVNQAALQVFGPTLGALVAGPDTDGYQDFGKAKTWLIRPSIAFEPNEEFRLVARYEHGEASGDGPAGHNHTNGSGLTNPFYSADRDSFGFSIDEPGYYENEWDQVILDTQFDVSFGDGTITNIFGWRQYDSDALTDIDATPLYLFNGGSVMSQEQISNELRYNGTLTDNVDVTAGLYYFSQDVAYNEPRFLLGGASFFNGGGVQDQQTIGVFSQFDVALSDKLTLLLGGRYTVEDKDVVISNLLLNKTPCDVRESGTCSEDFVDDKSWENFTPKIGFRYLANGDLNIYGHWTQAVRSGGYNLRNTSFSFDPGPFDEEKVNAYEIGAKSSLMSGRLQLNAALFYTDIKDMQREVLRSDPVAGAVVIVRNTADAGISGGELDARFKATDNLVLTGSVGWTDGEYDTVKFDLNRDGVLDSGDLSLEIPRLAPWTYNVGFVYSRAIAQGYVDINMNYAYRDRSYMTDDNFGVSNKTNMLDASIALTTLDERVTVSLYGKNLLNDVNFGQDSQLPAAFGGGTFSPLNKGRVVGLELKYAIN